MTTAALAASLRRMADIASSTDRAPVLAEAADRLEALAEDKARLDFIEAERVTVTAAGAYPGIWFCHRSQGKTLRVTIDAARRGENADA